jgi:hypothetical protein
MPQGIVQCSHVPGYGCSFGRRNRVPAKAEGQITSRSGIEQWIAQAQELAAAAGEGESKPFASFVV